MNHHLSNSDYLVMSLYLQPEQQRCIHLLFTITDENRLFGGFNVAYMPSGQIGSGIAIALRCQLIDPNWQEPEAEQSPFDPSRTYAIDQDGPFESDNERQLYNYLSDISGSLTVAPGVIELENIRDSLYTGIYRLLFPSVNSAGSPKQNLLIIYSSGAVLYLEEDNEGYAHGRLDQPNSNMLNITLRDHDNGQTGFLSVRVDNLNPNAAKEQVYYLAAFSGFEKNGNQVPVAAHVALEFMWGEIPPALDQDKEERRRLKERVRSKSIEQKILDWFIKENQHRILQQKHNLFRLNHF